MARTWLAHDEKPGNGAEAEAEAEAGAGEKGITPRGRLVFDHGQNAIAGGVDDCYQRR